MKSSNTPSKMPNINTTKLGLAIFQKINTQMGF
jgi:hypothetical protein